MKRLGIDFGSSYIKCSDAKKEELITLDKMTGGESLKRIPNIMTYYSDGKCKLGKVSPKIRNTEEASKAIIISNIKTRLADLKWFQTISPGKTVTAADVTDDIMKALFDIIHIKNKNETDYEATITVPVCFSERQREIVRRSAEKAGFHVNGIITEPFASLFYLMRDHFEEQHNVLIVDIGGSTLDMCLVEVNGNEDACKVETQATAGINFGGITINNSMIDDYLMITYTNLLSPVIAKKRDDLFQDVDMLKSEIFSEDFDEEDISDPVVMFFSTGTATIDMEMSAADVYKLLDEKKIKDRLFHMLDDVIDDSTLICSEITDVFLTGGSSMIPYFRNAVVEYLQDNGVDDTDAVFALYDELELEEQAVGSVALGAGIYNKIISDEELDFIIKDKIPFQIFTKEPNGERAAMLQANCTYLSYHSQPSAVRQDMERIEVFQKMPDGSGDDISLGFIAVDRRIPEICSLYRLGIDQDRRVYAEFGNIEGNKHNAVFAVVGEKQYLEIAI